MTHPLCRKKYGLDGLWSLGAYHGSLKALITKLKYRWVADVASRLADLIIEYMATYQTGVLDEIKKDRGASWKITAVPLHPKRLKWRGFNQSARLGQVLANRMGLEYQEILTRTKNTQPQVGLEASLRRENIKDAFDVLDQKPLGCNFLLIDDVWTTGSTLKECGYVLKKHGARKVWAITLAR